MQRYLALDIGEKRTGVALVDDQNKVATPLVTIESTPDSQKFKNAFRELVLEWEPAKIIFGLPIDLKGKESIAAIKMRTLVETVMKDLNRSMTVDGANEIAFEFMDERLTSAQAEKSLLKAEFSAKSRKEHRDALAAALIAQSWVDTL